MSNGLDRISNLPDEIIHHIFSSLPTQYMVQSSVLAKKWRNLWRSAPTLYFDRDEFRLPYETSDYDENVDSLFYEFVDCVLFLRDRSSIQKLHIRWSWGHNLLDSSRVYAWIFLASRDIQILHLDLNHPDDDEDDFEFSKVIPSALFMCKSLTKLTLHVDLHFSGYLILPSSMSLSGLKFLDLHRVTFHDKKSVEAFFSSCVVLESLILDNCTLSNLDPINIYAHRLKYLSFSTGVNGINLHVFAPRLKHFKFYVHDPYEKLVLDCPSLISADFFVELEYGELHPLVLLSTLKSVCSAQTIELSGDSLQVLLERINLPHETPISFLKLKFMKLLVTNDTIPLVALFGFCPNIESLVLDFDTYIPSGKKTAKKKEMGLFPKFDHLKSIVIHGFNGNEDQQEVLQILREKAVVLEKLTIYFKACTIPLEQKRLRDLSEKLSKFPNVRVIA